MARLVPELGLGTVVLAIGLMAKVLVPHFEDPDFYWHIKTGEYLLSAWPLPGSDVFTYTHSGNPGVLSEWLAQIVLYLVFATTGYFGTAVLVAALCAFCGWLTYRNCRRQMHNPVHAIIVALVWVYRQVIIGNCAFDAFVHGRRLEQRTTGDSSARIRPRRQASAGRKSYPATQRRGNASARAVRPKARGPGVLFVCEADRDSGRDGRRDRR